MPKKKEFTQYETEIIEALVLIGNNIKDHPLKLKDHPAREEYPQAEGWALLQDLNALTEKISKYKIGEVANQLAKRGMISQAYATYHDKDGAHSLIMRKLNEDLETLKLVWRCFSLQSRNNYFMTSEYYLRNPHTQKLIYDFNSALGFRNEAILAFDRDSFIGQYSIGEKVIIGIPGLFELFLTDKKKFVTVIKKIYELFPPSDNHEEALLFMMACAHFQLLGNALWHDEIPSDLELRKDFFLDFYSLHRVACAIAVAAPYLPKGKKRSEVKPDRKDASEELFNRLDEQPSIFTPLILDKYSRYINISKEVVKHEPRPDNKN